jgi:hypothetical protein
MRTLRAAKSKYYDVALEHLEAARKSYLDAGLDRQWEALALEIRWDHYRKFRFMPGFNPIVAGKSAHEAIFPRACERQVRRKRTSIVHTARTRRARFCCVRIALVMLLRSLTPALESANFRCRSGTAFFP